MWSRKRVVASIAGAFLGLLAGYSIYAGRTPVPESGQSTGLGGNVVPGASPETSDGTATDRSPPRMTAKEELERQVIELTEVADKAIPAPELRPTHDQLVAAPVDDLLAHPWIREVYGADAGDDPVFVGQLWKALGELRETREQMSKSLTDEISDVVTKRIAEGNRPGSYPQKDGELGAVVSCSQGTGWVGIPRQDPRFNAVYEKRAELRSWDLMALDRLSRLPPPTTKKERR